MRKALIIMGVIAILMGLSIRSIAITKTGLYVDVKSPFYSVYAKFDSPWVQIDCNK